MIDITLDGKKISVNEGTKIEDIINLTDNTYFLICGAFVNHEINSLKHQVSANQEITLIDITTEAGMRIYISTLLLIFSKAANSAFPDKEMSISYSLGGGIFCEFKDHTVMSGGDVQKIKEQMKQIIEKKINIKKHKIPWEEAYLFMRHHKMNSSTEPDLMLYVHAAQISLYEIDDFYGYYYSKVLSKTSDIYSFDLIPFNPGCVILGPGRKDPSKLKKFIIQKNLHEEFQVYEEWCARLNVSDVVSLNRKIEDGSIVNLITVAEARHEQLIARMAQEIYKKRAKKRVVLISGPTSSGKTTTSKRLRTHLIAMELNPIAISLDNYFVDRELTPRDQDGKLDLESIDAIDIKTFNENLLDLMDGKETEVPMFDFMTGRRLPKGRLLKVDKNSPIIIEGIHGLNEKLTHHIPKENKYKIYVNDLTHLNIDQNNRIPTSDVRLLRRIVRDNLQRGHDALQTISMWQSVKRGEEINIYPYSNEADFVFNSSLFYEMSVLKKYAEPALYAIKEDSEYFYEAKRMRDFLSFFLPLKDETPIYTNSILREFIGGNVFDAL